MNGKQTTPLLATLGPAVAAIAPPLLIGGLIILALDQLFPDDDKKGKLEPAPAKPEAESRKKAEIAPNTAVFRQIPAEIRAKPAVAPVSSAPRVAVPTPTLPSVPKVPVSVLAPPKMGLQVPPSPPIRRKFITRQDMVTIFQRGERALTRMEAVSALKHLGFGKTAAYAALSSEGRFSSWLKFAPDGIITWTELPKTIG